MEGKGGGTVPSNLPYMGILEWFNPGERERVHDTVALLDSLGLTALRTGYSWYDWHRGEAEWFEWKTRALLDRNIDVLPCLVYTPPELAHEPHCGSPPRDPDAYARFVDEVLGTFPHFEYVELWNEHPLFDWDHGADPNGTIFSEMIYQAGAAAHERNVKTVLGGMDRLNLDWWRKICERCALDEIDVIGFHSLENMATRESLDKGWEFAKHPGWEKTVHALRAVAEEHTGRQLPVWITELGYSAPSYEDQQAQTRHLSSALGAPVERIYWYSLRDLPRTARMVRDHSTGNGCEQHYHLGMIDASGTPKELYRRWKEHGLASILP